MSHSGSVIDRPVDLLGDVKAVLDAPYNDVGKLCSYVYINPLSRYKPVRHNSVGDVDRDTLMKSANFGFYSTTFNTIDPKLAFDIAVINDGAWLYERPTSASNYSCRLTDFYGYDHLTVDRAIETDCMVLPPEGEYQNIRLCFLFTVNSSAQIQLTDFNFANKEYYDSTGDYNYKYAVMLRKRGDTGQPTIHYGIDVFKLQNDEIVYNHRPYEGPNEVLVFDAPTDASTDVVYQMVPAIIKHASGTLTNGNVIYLYDEIRTYNGSPVVSGSVDQVDVLSKDVRHEPTAAEASAGTGYFSVVLRVQFRAISPTFRDEDNHPHFTFYARTKAGSNWSNYSSGVSIQLPDDYYLHTYTKDLNFLLEYDYPIPCAVVEQTASVFLELSGTGKMPVYGPDQGDYFVLKTYI